MLSVVCNNRKRNFKCSQLFTSYMISNFIDSYSFEQKKQTQVTFRALPAKMMYPTLIMNKLTYCRAHVIL